MTETADLYVLDTSAWLTLMEDEAGADIVQDLVERAIAGEVAVLVSFMSLRPTIVFQLPTPGLRRLPKTGTLLWFTSIPSSSR
jgi:uncharacterized protein with PIN domain